jgi:hypothetical protein
MASDGTPGFALRGELHEAPVTDWSFANEVDVCQIQISVGWRPHSLNLNCMATPAGELVVVQGGVGPGRLRSPGRDRPVHDRGQRRHHEQPAHDSGQA